MVPQRDANGPCVLRMTLMSEEPGVPPNAVSGKPPRDDENNPTCLSDRRAEGGTSKRKTYSCGSPLSVSPGFVSVFEETMTEEDPVDPLADFFPGEELRGLLRSPPDDPCEGVDG